MRHVERIVMLSKSIAAIIVHISELHQMEAMSGVRRKTTDVDLDLYSYEAELSKQSISGDIASIARANNASSVGRQNRWLQDWVERVSIKDATVALSAVKNLVKCLVGSVGAVVIQKR